MNIYIMNTSVYLMGGLGNQLFQLFALLSYTKKYNKKPIMKYSDKLTTGKTRPTYWDTFLSKLKKYTTTNDFKLPLMREQGFNYSEIPLIQKPFQLYGYFQSYKYFNENYHYIIHELDLKNNKNKIMETYNHYFNNNINISMHFRLGDYKHQQHNHPVMPVVYYMKSIQHIINTINNDTFNILYFCEKEDNDDVLFSITILKKKFPNITFTKVDDTIDDWKQMLLMSCCNHNIIANSSFSWWGAYFNDYKDKIVCYPNIWFGPSMKKNTKDLFPDEWKKISF